MLSRYPPGTLQDRCETTFARRATAPLRARRSSLCWGAASAALKYSIWGDIALIDRQEVETLIARGADGPQLLR
jgi:hypothetical protein